MEFYNGMYVCAICNGIYNSSEATDECFVGHSFEQIGEYLHLRLCACRHLKTCSLHSDGRGNPEGHMMYWHREATTCAVIAQQYQISLREAVFRYINSK